MSNLIPIIGQKNTRKIDEITLPQPDGSFVSVKAAAVVAIAPEVVAALASGFIAALISRGYLQENSVQNEVNPNA